MWTESIEVLSQNNGGCDFCNGKPNENGTFGVEQGTVTIDIWKDEHQDIDDEFYLNVMHFNNLELDEENFKINYCPMCGVRLVSS